MYDKIHELLADLKLKGINEKLDEILASTEKKGLSTVDVLNQLLQEELFYRRGRSVEYRLAKAGFPEKYCLDEFPFEKQPSINKTQIRNFANLGFIERNENIVLIGKPGTGKTGIAVSLVREAIINGYRGYFCGAQKLLEDLYSALADRHSARLLKQLSSYDVMIIDELGYLTINSEQSNAFFKLMDMRYNKKATIITTNLDYPEWYALFNKKSLVDALLDRLRHHCFTIRIEGQSLREPNEPQNCSAVK